MFQWAVGHGMQAVVPLKGCLPSNDQILGCCWNCTVLFPAAAVTIIGGGGVVRHSLGRAPGRVLLHIHQVSDE
jgi:hypothetical protein